MNDQLTEIAFILDRSGSMQALVEPAIAGFNRLLREQQQEPGSPASPWCSSMTATRFR